jgi:RecJ-like exonuclease
MVKISARASNSLLEKGLNLGAIMQKAAEKVEGRGGGHDVAAGALLPKGSEDLFLNETIKLLEEVLG